MAEIKNRFNGEVICEGPTLRVAVITAHRDGVSLYGADLRGIDLSKLELNGIDLRKADISHASFEGANLEGADLSFTEYTDTNFSCAYIHDIDIGGTGLRRNLSSGDLE